MRKYLFFVVIILFPFLVGSQAVTKPAENKPKNDQEVDVIKAVLGVIDRYVNDQAVILLEEINEELVMDQMLLPPNADEGTWVIVKQEKGGIITFEVDEEKTNEQIKKTNKLLRKVK